MGMCIGKRFDIVTPGIQEDIKHLREVLYDMGAANLKNHTHLISELQDLREFLGKDYVLWKAERDYKREFIGK